MWPSKFDSDGVFREFAKALTASKIRVKINHGLWQWVVMKKVVHLFFKSSKPSFSLIIYSSIEHVNSVPFKFVPDPFLAGGSSFTVPSTYIGIWMLKWPVKFLFVIPWMALVPWILRFTDFEDLIVAALACNFCRILRCRMERWPTVPNGAIFVDGTSKLVKNVKFRRLQISNGASWKRLDRIYRWRTRFPLIMIPHFGDIVNHTLATWPTICSVLIWSHSRQRFLSPQIAPTAVERFESPQIVSYASC